MVGLTPRQGLKRSRQLALSCFLELITSARQTDTDLFEDPPFRNLQNLVFGQRHDRGWEFLKDKTLESQKLQYAQVAAFVYAHQPPSICSHANYGPYGSQLFTIVNTNTHSTTVTRHSYDFDSVYPQIVCGAYKRWIMYPGTVVRDFFGPEDEQRGTLFLNELVAATAQLLNYEPGVGQEEKTPDAGTTVDIYGPAMSGAARSHLLVKDDRSFDPPEVSEMGIHARKIYEDLKGRVASLKADLQADEGSLIQLFTETLAGLPDKMWKPWLHKIKFRPWGDVPACDCCGWTTEAFMEEFNEGLHIIASMGKLLRDAGEDV